MFGDQNLFCRKSDFLRAEGFDDALPIMEDLDLVMRLHMKGPALQQTDYKSGECWMHFSSALSLLGKAES